MLNIHNLYYQIRSGRRLHRRKPRTITNPSVNIEPVPINPDQNYLNLFIRQQNLLKKSKYYYNNINLNKLNNLSSQQIH